MDNLELTNEEMNSLCQSILKRYGIDFTCYEPKSLRRRMLRVMSLYNLPNSYALWMKLLQEPDFVKPFLSEVSVGMTSMFRDPELWVALKKRLANEFRHRSTMKVWHAGCSTGEEVYSLGVLLQEMKLQHIATALATDFNDAAVREAQAGVYHKIKTSENAAAYKQVTSYRDFSTYYTEIDSTQVQMHRDLVKHVEFRYHNLITDTFQNGFDVIFCRNVMIYFDVPAKRRLLDKFYEALNPGGLFIIGFYDAVMNIVNDEKLEVVDADVKIFRKRGNGSLSTEARDYLTSSVKEGFFDAGK
ncbi:protein-glutamate O-methyltransferase CheR [Chryseolinea sp. T2]|uniref:CheR family methyltransferase n=1 Tax=Chryseolinea sp. T2 TaxID=3129255 RepID=UPI0030770671